MYLFISFAVPMVLTEMLLAELYEKTGQKASQQTIRLTNVLTISVMALGSFIWYFKLFSQAPDLSLQDVFYGYFHPVHFYLLHPLNRFLSYGLALFLESRRSAKG